VKALLVHDDRAALLSVYSATDDDDDAIDGDKRCRLWLRRAAGLASGRRAPCPRQAGMERVQRSACHWSIQLRVTYHNPLLALRCRSGTVRRV